MNESPASNERRSLPPCGQPTPRVAPPAKDADRHWPARKSNVKKMWYGGCAILAVLALLDTVVHGRPHFGIDGVFGFYSWYGFITCIGMIVLAKVLGGALKRKDTYYDDE